MFGKVNQKNSQINEEGIGLGLYITKNLINQMGGLIELNSRENEFTKFTVTLPVRRGFKVQRETLKTLNTDGAQVMTAQDEEGSAVELDINRL